jgi:tetratricopeptide (TPR) repeat protein
MKSTILVLILFFSLLFIPVVSAEDAMEWYTKGQDALKVGDYAAAVTYYSNALQQDKNMAQAYAGRAAALNMQGKYTEALGSADSALAIKPMDPVALNARAFAFFSLGQYDKAAAAYDNLFVVEQNRKDAYCNQAYAYLVLNDTAPALVAFDRCTLLDSGNFMAWNNMGQALMLAGKYDSALSAFDRATTLTIKNATVWNNKGKALVALGRPTDALECFNKALGIDPDFAEAQANKADAIGRQQSFTIAGTVTPKETVSRIGTLFTIVTTAPQAPAVVTGEQQEQMTGTETGAVTKTTIPKKTTYSPVSPVTVLFALAVIAGLAVVMRRE